MTENEIQKLERLEKITVGQEVIINDSLGIMKCCGVGMRTNPETKEYEEVILFLSRLDENGEVVYKKVGVGADSGQVYETRIKKEDGIKYLFSQRKWEELN